MLWVNTLTPGRCTWNFNDATIASNCLYWNGSSSVLVCLQVTSYFRNVGLHICSRTDAIIDSIQCILKYYESLLALLAFYEEKHLVPLLSNLDPWIKDQVKITLLSILLPQQLRNFVICGTDMSQNVTNAETKLCMAKLFREFEMAYNILWDRNGTLVVERVSI